MDCRGELLHYLEKGHLNISELQSDPNEDEYWLKTSSTTEAMQSHIERAFRSKKNLGFLSKKFDKSED